MDDGGSPLRRLWVVGPCGSGKSHAAGRLAERLGVAPTHIDDIHWNPGWVESDPESTFREVERIAARPAWVIDGNYTHIRTRLERKPDLIIWLDLPFHVTFPRLIRRTLRRSIRGEPCCNGNRESLRRALFHPDSILWWAIRTHRSRRRCLQQELAGQPHFRLRTPAEVRRFLDDFASVKRIKAEVGPPRP